MTYPNETLPWWKKDHKINWRPKQWLLALVFLVLPNVFFLMAAYFMGLARPLVNVDYFLACLLLVLPFRVTKWVGVLVFVLMACLDAAMLAMQLFPFLDLAAVWSLAPFLVNAPVRYQVLLLIFVLYVPLFIWCMRRYVRWFLGAKADFWYVLMVTFLGCVIYYNFQDLRYVKGADTERFAQSDYFYIHSQYQRYRWVAGSEFALHFNNVPTVARTDAAYISHHFDVKKAGIAPVATRPLVTDTKTAQLGDFGVVLSDEVVRKPSNKKLLIMAESWGVARNPAVQREILAGIYENAGHLAFLDTGYFGFSGATVEGELRELCQLGVEGGYAFSRLDGGALQSCLPNRLKKEGYHTVGMHAGYSTLYERHHLYPMMGFAEVVFAETMEDKKRCSPFNGVCDGEMFSELLRVFGEREKVFFYWLTLTSHSPFSDKDLTNPRLDCQKYDIPVGDICNSFRLQAQFFDELGQILTRPEMRGVEVIVVGDHMPPILTKGRVLHPYIQWQDVSWVHFKVKD